VVSTNYQLLGPGRRGVKLIFTMRACEIKALRWYDVDFLASTIAIRKSKTQAAKG
jgi:hypothetical protein